MAADVYALPPEIWLMILDDFEGTSDMKNYSMTSQGFRQLALPYLFTKVILLPEVWTNDKSLIDFIGCQHLHAYVQKLSIGTRNDRKSYTCTPKRFCEAIACCTNLVQLIVCDLAVQDKHAQGFSSSLSLPPLDVNALCLYERNPLRSFGSILRLFSHVKHLEVSIEIPDIISEATHLPIVRIPVKDTNGHYTNVSKLDVGQVDTLAMILPFLMETPTANIPTLTSFTCHRMLDEDFSLLQKFIDAVGASLEVLALQFPEDTEACEIPILPCPLTLSACKSLRRYEYSINFQTLWMSDSDTDKAWRFLEHTIRSLPDLQDSGSASHPLSHFSVGMTWVEVDSDPLFISPSAAEGLEVALLEPRFSQLKEMVFDMACFRFDGENVTPAPASVDSRVFFPGLVAKGILRNLSLLHLEKEQAST